MKDLVVSHLNRKKGTPYEKQTTLIHSDRGTEFCNQNWTSLDEYEYVELSMSRMATPRDNAVIERLFGTIKRDKSLRGQTGKYKSLPSTVKNLTELRFLVENIVYRYNTEYRPKRTGKVPPDYFYELICTDQEENPLSSIRASTKYDEVTTESLNAYKKELGVAQDKEIKQLNTKLDMINSNLIQVATGMGEKLNTIETKVDSIEDKLTKPKRKKKETRQLRDPLMKEHLELFLETNMDHEVYINLRNKVAIILLCALGCRNSEILEFTYDDIEVLIASRQITLNIKKTGKKVYQPISEYHAVLIELYYNKLIEVVGGAKGSWYVFTPISNKEGVHLHVDYFNTTLNDFLREFCTTCGLDNEYLTHSGRIGFVTNLLEHRIPIDIVAKLVHHDDLRSTMKYDRFVLDIEQKKDILNETN
jgi:site-specific recombinase XerD